LVPDPTTNPVWDWVLGIETGIGISSFEPMLYTNKMLSLGSIIVIN
jgi:hypothetical protein